MLKYFENSGCARYAGTMTCHLKKPLLVGACLLVLGVAHAQNVAGVVKKMDGNVSIQRDGQTLPVQVGTTLRAGDVLRTGDAASTGVMLKDETRVSLGPNSQVVLDKFAFNADTHQGNFLVRIFKGTLMMVSGLIVKANPSAASVRTPTGTVGIRGTEFIVDIP